MFSGIWQKLGYWPSILIKEWKNKTDWIWIHAVSVGEFNAIYPLIIELRKNRPEYPIMVSCTTNNGYKIAKNKTAKDNILVFYFPFDIPYIINKLFNIVKVKLLIIVETEIWPNLLIGCKKRNISTMLLNARLSDKSFRNYMLFKFYFKTIINHFDEILAQSENDYKKFIELGFKKSKITITGNIKFAHTEGDNNFSPDIITSLGIKDTTNIIFASTHKGEEEIALNIFKDLVREFSYLRLIIAPRHIERIKSISLLVKKHNLQPKLRSKNEILSYKNDVLLLDTIGELKHFYKVSQITILGGTFVKTGGHNILEPIREGSCTIIGPNDFKIKELSDTFKRNNALIQVNNLIELKSKIKELLKNKETKKEIIQNGQKILIQNEHVFKQTFEQVLAFL